MSLPRYLYIHLHLGVLTPESLLKYMYPVLGTFTDSATTFKIPFNRSTMKLSTVAVPLVTFLAVDMTSAWKLQAGHQVITGTKPQGCTAVNIPRGAQISWTGTHGATTVEFFTTEHTCSRVYRTVMGIGDINASENIYGFVVKA